jgi:hypothetical protein
MIRQLVLQSKKDLESEQYENDKLRIIESLSKQAANTERFCNAINPYPISYSQEELMVQERIQKTLSKAINAIVSNYLKDKRIQEIIKLDERTIELLKCASQMPYHIGAYRPDFLYDSKGNIIICEINARFATNAFFITHYLRHCNFVNPSEKVQQYKGNNIAAFVERIPQKHTVYIVKGRESGWDIYCLANELQKLGRTCAIIPPSALHLVASREDASFILELHQDEILADGVYETLCTLAKSRNYFNDLRTIFIAHDKRMLAVLHRKDIMKDYIGDEDFEFLRNHVAKTYVLGSDLKQVAILDRENWMLKPTQFGKGEGIVLGHQLSQEDWEKAVHNADYSKFVLQQVVLQQQTEILTMIDQNTCLHNMNVVGTILCIDDDYLGPGIYRASENEIVNVASGGAILFAVMDNN